MPTDVCVCRQESVNVSDLTLTSITSIAERTITSDLESLVQKVRPTQAWGVIP